MARVLISIKVLLYLEDVALDTLLAAGVVAHDADQHFLTGEELLFLQDNLRVAFSRTDTYEATSLSLEILRHQLGNALHTGVSNPNQRGPSENRDAIACVCPVSDRFGRELRSQGVISTHA